MCDAQEVRTSESLHHCAKFLDNVHVLDEGINSGVARPWMESDEAPGTSMSERDLEKRQAVYSYHSRN